MKPLVRMVDVPIRHVDRERSTVVNLEITECGFLLILGNNGSGKSRLLNLIAGLDLPGQGEVFIRGERLTRMSDTQRRHWRSRLGLIPADPYVLEDYSVLENLVLTAQLLGKNEQDSKRNARESAALCGLEKLLDVSVSSLSLGLRKRLVIARSLVNQPELILADVPLEGLDEKAQEEFLYICTKLAQIGYPIVLTSSAPLPFEISVVETFVLPEVANDFT